MTGTNWMRWLAAVLAGLLTATILGSAPNGYAATATPGTARHGPVAAVASGPAPPPAAGTFNAVACVSAADCIAGGFSEGEAGNHPLAEQWNGSGWTPLARPLSGSVSALACPRASSCQAVSAGEAERWNGTAWTKEKTPTVTGADLHGLSCPAVSDCVAVGIRAGGKGGAVLAETWNGSAWTVHNPVNPAGALQASLSWVSCASRTACIAVGDYEYSAGSFATLAESWNGSAWKLLAMPTPSTDAGLSGVSCASAANCVAVGFAAPGTLAESWNGTSWTVLPAPPDGGTAISCTATTSCMAVGGTAPESWNGSSWKALSPPPLQMAFVNGISCTSAANCMAVGHLADVGSFAMSWNGVAWRALRVDHLDQLSGVSCTLATRCMAAGSFLATSDQLATLAESWNGSSWQRRGMPASADSQLKDVSCVSAADCVAVGGHGPDGSLTLAEAWNGVAWRVTPTPNLPPDSQLNAVSCAGRRCLAVGFAFLAEAWNGATWRAINVPHPSHFFSGGLTDVSCASSDECLATGFYFTSPRSSSFSLAELWNGKSWRMLHPPGNGLNTVSCTGASFCMTVGHDTAEIWNGASWRTQKLVGPFGFGGPGITAVSCVSRSGCMAVGNYLALDRSKQTAGFNVTEFWNGSRWLRLPAAGPGGGLTDVSCTSASRCMAVGAEPAGQVGTHTLAEQWNGRRWRVLVTRNP